MRRFTSKSLVLCLALLTLIYPAQIIAAPEQSHLKTLSAANSTPTPDPNSALYPEMPQNALDAVAANAADLLSREITHYHIAYLVDEPTAKTHILFGAKALETTLGAEVFHTWEDFVATNDEAPFEIILLHASMLDAVDAEWMQWAYRNNVLLMHFEIPHDQLAVLLDDACLQKEGNPNPQISYEKDSVIMRTYSLKLEDETLRERLDSLFLETCSNQYETESRVELLNNMMQLSFENYPVAITPQEVADWIAQVLIAETTNYGLPNRSLD